MFRADFVWGVASSAYQIEGRDAQDGAGKCIWDSFIQDGHIPDHSDARMADDHMHRYPEDYRLMRLLGIKAYRFSISWSRILPEGTGKVNEKAVALYRDMILEMKKNGITPYLTMYHWEFPQALQDRGGWLNEQVSDWFAEYAKVVAENFSDICEYFITLNEPQCFVGLGHLSGVQAPGAKLPPREVFQIAHNALKAHGKAVIALRGHAKQPIKVGYAPTCGMAYPASDKPEDIEAAKKVLFGFYQPIENWTWNVAWFSDPVFLGKYPEEGLKKYAAYLPKITPEDMQLISQPLDFMGQNIYNGYPIRAGENGEPEFVNRPVGSPKTAANWPVTPQCLYWGVKFLYERYQLPLYITENGMSCHDVVSVDGRVHDPNRQDFLDRYLSALQQASDEGADVRGYFLWTFLDNFEWDKGYTERFGIVYVDYETQERIVKDSAFWYQKVIEANGMNLTCNQKERQPIFLEPVFKERIWGGSRMRDEYGYAIPAEDTGECWAISAHPNGDCVIRDGIYKGETLSGLFEKEPELFGNLGLDRFPLLIKIIDAKEDLSIQVHPDDAYAGVHENGSLGKTECWYVLDCKEDSTLVVGHNAKTREELEDMIRSGKWSELIREIPIHKGDFIQINPGCMHAIKGGVMVLETQQNSDVTYRVYDYDRLSDGKPRELHVQQSIDVITVPAAPVQECVKRAAELPDNEMNLLINCDYYQVWLMNVTKPVVIDQKYPFLNVSILEGEGLIEGRMVKKGDHLILPAGMGKVDIQGEMKIIASTVNQ